MKKIIFTLLLILPSILNAQKISESSIDEFTKKINVESEYVSMKSSLYGNSISFGISAESDSSIYLFSSIVLSYSCAMTVEDKQVALISKGSKVIFKGYSGEVLTLTSGESKYGDLEPDGNYKFFIKYYPKSKKELDFFITNEIEKIRVYTDNNFYDFDVSKKKSNKIGESYKLVLKELEKYK